MNLYYLGAILLIISMPTIEIEGAKFQPIMMKGNFKSCLKGICHLVEEIFFVENECFNKRQELGIFYYLKGLLHVAQLNRNYEISKTDCTISADDLLNSENDHFNEFIDDQYKIVYLCILVVEKILICLLGYFVFKYKKLLLIQEKPGEIVENTKNNTHLEIIKEHHSLQPSAPPMPKNTDYQDVEKKISETTASLLSSTRISNSISDIYPSFTSSSVNESQTKVMSCSCHATELVCTNCSCVRNKRPCNFNCHISKNKTKRQQPVAFRCINKFN